MRVLKLSRTPAPCIQKGSTIRDVVSAMAEVDSGALVVLEGEKLAGIVSERDVVLRAVGRGLDPNTTRVDEIMTSPVESVNAESPTGAAIEVMTRNRFRHLAVTDDENRVVGLLSSRQAFHEYLDHMYDQLQSLESFLGADGPGG